MVKNVRKGDTVITSGGLVGRVTKVVDDDQIEVEIADGVRVRQMREMVSDVRAKGEPVKDEDSEELIRAGRRGRYRYGLCTRRGSRRDRFKVLGSN